MAAVGTSNNQIRVAIATLLNGDGPLQGLVGGIFDVGGVPEGQAFPYVVLGESIEIGEDTLGMRGYFNTLSVHIWTQARGFQFAYTILARLNILLHRTQLSLSTQFNVGVWYLNAISVMQPDGLTQHVMPRYWIITQEVV